WLEQLIALAESAPSIGLAGPTSNYASPPQLVADVPYRDLAGMHAFAARRRAEHRGRWQTAAKPSGFCLLMRRAVLEAVGGAGRAVRVGVLRRRRPGGAGAGRGVRAGGGAGLLRASFREPDLRGRGDRRR